MKTPLAALDYYFFRKNLYTIQFVFEYRGRLDSEKLLQNVEKTIGIFEALGSRIKILSPTEIALETGYAIALRTCTVEQEPVASNQADVEQFVDSVKNIEGEPLVKILVTHTPTRSFVGFSFSHLLGDGTTFFTFLDALSKISRSEIMETKPSHQRNLLKLDSTSHAGSTNLFLSSGYTFPDRPAFENYELVRFHISKRELVELRASCANQGAVVSVNDILMATLAKKFHRDIPSYENKFIVRCPVDYRRILGLPAGYFGNAVRDAVVSFEADEIEVLPLHEIALRIRLEIRKVDRISVEESVRSLDRFRRKNGIDAFENVGCPGLLVSNLSTFPIRKMDFGLGSPIGLYPLPVTPRLGLILPASDGLTVEFRRPMLVA